MKTTDVIDGAIEAVTGNWCQGNLFTEEGQLCLRGALYMGAGVKFETVEFSNGSSMVDMNFDDYDQDAFNNAIYTVTKEVGEHIPDFNDRSTTSEEDVILVLKRAREKLS
jgi:hypothetical protein